MGIPYSDEPVMKAMPRYPEVPAWSEGVSNPNAWEIDKLCDFASQYMRERQYEKAETALRQAILLNEKVYNAGMYRYMCDELAKFFKNENQYSEQEKTYKTMSKTLGLWDSPQFRNRIAMFYIDQARYPEARAILRVDLPKMRPPTPGGSCGTLSAMYSIAQNRYERCITKTKNLTDAQLDQIADELKNQYCSSSQSNAMAE